jgi:hypothetical protein
MLHLEPTYLRFIYDGLIKGSIHPENAAELPEGLIGLYEEAFDEKQSVHIRQQLLERFAIWALLKKEVSAQFVSEVLNQSEEENQEFIATYSAWFNSPESGKYQLYHERLKVYLLQKLSVGQTVVLNKRIIQFLSLQFSVAQKNESVLYCYQYLPFHAFVAAKINSDSALLCELCLSNSFKERQFDLSDYYDWEENMMALGVEYFSLNQNSICHHIVFEKTKIHYKKKDIDLILFLIRNGEMETVFRFFQNTSETNLYARVELAYFYFFSFFEIFEKADWNFIKRKEIGSKLLEIFEDNFRWDSGYYLSQFLDVNISFRLHCYFEQFGLHFKSIAILSSDQVLDYYDLQMDEPLRFIGKNHLDEAKAILKDFKKFDYGIKDSNLEGIIYSDYEGAEIEGINQELRRKISNFSKMQLLRDELAYSSEKTETFDELCSFVKQTLRKIEITRDIKLRVLREFKTHIKADSTGLYTIQGNFENSDGKNTLEFIRNDIDKQNEELKSLPELISDGLVIEEFMSMELNKRYKLLNDENLDSDEDIELMLFFMELSEYYQKEEPKDLLNLLSVLLIEFHLNINDQLIDKYMDELTDLISSSSEASEEFESKIFVQLLDFFNRSDVNGQRKRNLIIIQETLIETFLDFSFYNYSFVVGCHLINLFSKFNIEFPEEEIVDRIIDDLNNLIEENDYNEMFEIEGSSINNIYEKPYFWDYYSAVKRIHIEQVRIDLSKYVFRSIIEVKGLNHNTVSFFRENTNEFPGMYIWAQNRLSQKLLEKNEELSYVVIKDNNDLLLERLLLNIVSKRENLKEELNIQILKHYGLDWVIELDQEYERLISINN